MPTFKKSFVVLILLIIAIAWFPNILVSQPKWEKVEIPGLPEWAEYVDLWSASPTDVFVVIGVHGAFHNQRPMHTMVYYFDGTNWTMIFDEEGYRGHHNMIFGTSPSNVYLIANHDQGDGHIWHFNGSVWQEMVVPSQWSQDWQYKQIGGSENNIHMYIQYQDQKNVIRFDGQAWHHGITADIYGLMREFISPNEGYVSNVGLGPSTNWAKWDGNNWIASASNGRRDTQFSIWGTRDQDNTLHLYDCGEAGYTSDGFLVTKINENLIDLQDVVSEDPTPGTCNGIWGPRDQGNDIYAVGHLYGDSSNGDGSDFVRVWHTSDGINWEIIDDDIAAAVGVTKLGDRGYQVWGTSSEDVWIVTRDALYRFRPGATSSLAAHWPMNEGSGNMIYDDSGNDNHGTLNGPEWTFGVGSSALSFDGIDDYVDCGNDNSLNFGTGDFTIEAWVKPNTISGYYNILMKGEDKVTNFMLVRISDGGMVLFGAGRANAEVYFNGDKILSIGNWHHVVVVREENKHSIYIDGEFDKSKSRGPYDVNTLRPLNIGRKHDSGVFKHYFDGLIDDVSIYNRALSAEEILERYEQFTSPNTPPIADANGPYVKPLGTPIYFDGSESIDPDGDVLSYNWDLGDGGSATGVTPQYSYMNPGEYIVILTVDDGKGGIDHDTTNAVIFPNQESEWHPRVSGVTETLNDVHRDWAVGNNGIIIKSSGAYWNRQNSGVTNHLKAVAFIDNQQGWAVGDSGAVLKTTDGGYNWISITQELNFPEESWRYTLYDIHFIDPLNGCIVGNGAISFWTVDGGNSWMGELLGWPGEDAFFGVHLVDQTTGFVSGSTFVIGDVNHYGMLWQATDGGQTVNPVFGASGGRLNDVFFFDSQTGWVVGEGNTIRKTTDGGNNWMIQDFGASNSYQAVHFVTATEGWIVGNNGFIIHTTDGGETWNYEWTDVTDDLNGLYFSTAHNGLAVGENGTILRFEFNSPPVADAGGPYFATDDNTITFSGSDSYDFGWPGSWSLTYAWDFGDGGTSTEANPQHTYPNVGLYTVILTVEDEGGKKDSDTTTAQILPQQEARWREQDPGISASLRSVHFTSDQVGWAVGANGTIISTVDAGKSWQKQNSGVTNNLASVFFTSSLDGWAVGSWPSTLLRTSDGGENWYIQENSLSFSWPTIYFSDSQHGWIAHGRDVIYRTDDGGDNWTSASLGSFLHYSTNSVFFTNSMVGYACGELWDQGDYQFGSVIKSIDGGIAWHDIVVGHVEDEIFDDLYFVGPETGWVVGTSGMIRKTTDGGQNWVIQDFGADRYRAVHFVSSLEGWLVSREGNILHTTDGGEIWIFEKNQPVELSDVHFPVMNQGWAVGDNGTILHYSSGEVVAKANISLPETSAPQNTSITIPITVDTDSAIGLAQFVVEYSSNLLTYQNAQTGPNLPGSITLQTNTNLPFSPTHPGTDKNILFQLSGGGTSSFTGKKEVINLTFQVIGSPGTEANIYFDRSSNHTFLTTTKLNEIASDAISFSDGKINILHPSFTVHGTVSYTTSQRPVQSCAISVNEVGSGQTDSNGHYSISEIPTGTYTVIPEKTGDLGSAISGSDGLAVLRYLAFLKTLTDHQKKAADITQDGRLSGSDGLGLLRYLAFFPDNIGQTGQWKFWPDEAQVTGLPDVQQDFTTTIIGDVTQNWNQGSVLAKINTNIQDAVFGTSKEIPVGLNTTAESHYGLAKTSNFQTQWDPLVEISFPEQVGCSPGDTLLLPIAVSTDSSIGFAQFVIDYDSTVIQFVSAALGPGTTDFLISGINPNLPFTPEIVTANKNVLVQMNGGGNATFSGENLEILILKFLGVGKFADETVIAFDLRENHTILTTKNLVDVQGSNIGIRNCQLVLPVTLISFEAQVDGSLVILTWTVSSEVNNFGFTVERSQDKVNFSKIGFVSGDSSDRIYQFNDSPGESRQYFYRLKQVDLDGKTSFLALLSVAVTVPQEIQLHQNYPNPFNPTTEIHFDLPEASQVRLEIYNLLGQKVRTLIDEIKPAGFHNIQWDARDDLGRSVPGGVYLYRMQAGKFTEIRKMILMK